MINKDFIINKLNKLYPEKVIIGLNKKDLKLYRYFNEYAKESNLSHEEFSKKLGFEWQTITNNGYIYDVEALKKIVQEYNGNKSEIADFFGLSRERI